MDLSTETAAEGTGDDRDAGWVLPGYGEILIDAPPGGWEGVVPGEAI
jgi:hypothetical protein